MAGTLSGDPVSLTTTVDNLRLNFQNDNARSAFTNDIRDASWTCARGFVVVRGVPEMPQILTPLVTTYHEPARRAACHASSRTTMLGYREQKTQWSKLKGYTALFKKPIRWKLFKFNIVLHTAFRNKKW